MRKQAWLVLPLALLAACAPPVAPREQEAPNPIVFAPKAAGGPEELYTVPLDPWRTAAFDRDGSQVPEEARYRVLCDSITGEPQCRLYTRAERLGENEDGSPVIRHWSALRDLDGTLLADWSEDAYDTGYGTFVIRRNDPYRRNREDFDLKADFHTELWNYRTGEVIPDVDWVDDLGDGRVLALGVSGKPLGVLDASGNIVSGFPGPEGYLEASTWNGHIIANRWRGQEYNYDNMETILLDQTLQPLFSHQIIDTGYGNLRGPYLISWDGYQGIGSDGDQRILSAKGETLYVLRSVDSVEYFDGERMILASDPAPGETPSLLRLMAADGTVLSEGYRLLEPENWRYDDGNEPARRFIGLRDRNTVELLDRDGRVTASVQIPGVDRVEGCGRCFIFHLDGGEAGLLDADLNIVIPAMYQSIYPADAIAGKSDLLRCVKTLPGGISRIDVRAYNGNALVSDLTELGDVGPDRMAVVKGFSMGLMDREGNWIAKHSIFTDLEDERSLTGMW